MTTVDQMEEQMKPIIHSRRSPTRMISTKSTLQQFRLHPERFLSQSNRYLPLLRRQALKAQSHLKDTDGSDLTYDDAKSFLSEEIESNHSKKPKVRAPKKIDLMETTVVDTSERTMALSRLRQREYTHLQKLVHSKSIDHILEPLSPSKQPQSRCLKDVLHSIDSLRCSTTCQNQQRRQSDIERNISKLGILIF
ncbi:unnamed protein product [Adineta ricciae]|nr:unnamed protein product [Adineta ricciae]